MQNSVVFSEAGNDYTRIEQLCNLLREIPSVGRAARSDLWSLLALRFLHALPRV